MSQEINHAEMMLKFLVKGSLSFIIERIDDSSVASIQFALERALAQVYAYQGDTLPEPLPEPR